MTKEEKILGAVSLTALGLYLWSKPKKASAVVEGATIIPPKQAVFEDPVLCKDARQPWGTIQWSKVEDAAQAGVDKYLPEGEQPESLAAAKELSFYATQHAVKILCPSLDVPSTPVGLEAIYSGLPTWYRDLWDRVSLNAWQRVQQRLGGG